MFEEKKCDICGKPYIGYGNNAKPYMDGICCDECNMKFVIPARFEKWKQGDVSQYE